MDGRKVKGEGRLLRGVLLAALRMKRDEAAQVKGTSGRHHREKGTEV